MVVYMVGKVGVLGVMRRIEEERGGKVERRRYKGL